MLFNRKQGKKRQQKQMDELTKKMEQLEVSLQKLVDQGITYDVHIDHLNVHDPVLKSLTFRFDKLDVKEVSGALNLGNNFGVKVDAKPKSQQSKTPSKEKTVPKATLKKQHRQAETTEEVHHHEKGMTFRFDE
ncbi:putative FlaG/YvyC family protein [Pullulanibacillus pueri]|uniref:Uncharacterized protein n=1 Tax=Pullulanibacillus pueri TaxID=1437324 RepID=A0A8J2ZZK6_9BACL|nr:hypothetical protein [Pullulanibacillus pueri]MBM7683840.1 putative FlaG/YvyC family protein [Pullulanibacillus pueri]GGH87723.1 hypothetical protein GCM10007096_38390 [Pullulanibacillus pueri]